MKGFQFGELEGHFLCYFSLFSSFFFFSLDYSPFFLHCFFLSLFLPLEWKGDAEFGCSEDQGGGAQNPAEELDPRRETSYRTDPLDAP